MKGNNGVQMQVHPKFLEIIKKIKTDRIKLGKEGAGDLSHKRLTLTLYKLLTSNTEIYNLITNADIDLEEK
ncbi:MAG: hypothetical protein ACOC4L_03290 [Halanaerobium sp.]